MMRKDSPNRYEQQNLNKEIKALKQELEDQQIRNKLLEEELSLLKRTNPEPTQITNAEVQDIIMPEPIPANNLPIAIWEEDFSVAHQYIQQLTKRGITDLKTYFESHQEEFIDLLKKVKVHHLNEAGQKFTPTRKEVTNLYEMLGPDGSKNALGVFYAIRDLKHWFNFELVIVMSDGQEQNVIIQFSVMSGCANDYSRVLVALTNITERRTAEKKLKETNRQISTLIDNLNGIAYRCLNNSDWTMLFLSDAIFKNDWLHNRRHTIQ